MKLRRAIPIGSIDPSLLGPNSPLLELLRRSPRKDREHQDQVKLFAWAFEHEKDYPELRWLFAVPNGAFKSKAAAGRFKAEGLKPGVLDVWLPISRGDHPGLVIEMKVKPNGLSSDQRKWKAHLESQRWVVWVAYDSDTAISYLERYLTGDSWAAIPPEIGNV